MDIIFSLKSSTNIIFFIFYQILSLPKLKSIQNSIRKKQLISLLSMHVYIPMSNEEAVEPNKPHSTLNNL